MKVAVILALVCGIATVFSAGTERFLLRRQQCQTFLELITEEGPEKILQDANYFETFLICQRLLGLQDTSTASKGGSAHPMNRVSYRREQAQGNLDQCKIMLYPRNAYGGDPAVLERGRHRLPRALASTRSIRTIGSCCWVLFKSYGFQGERRIISGASGRKFLSKMGFRAGEVRSIRRIDYC